MGLFSSAGIEIPPIYMIMLLELLEVTLNKKYKLERLTLNTKYQAYLVGSLPSTYPSLPSSFHSIVREYKLQLKVKRSQDVCKRVTSAAAIRPFHLTLFNVNDTPHSSGIAWHHVRCNCNNNLEM